MTGHASAVRRCRRGRALRLLLCAALAGAAGAEPFDTMLDAGGAFWSLTPDAFMEAWKDKGFRWTSSEKDAARAYKTAHTFLEQPVVEAIVRFEDGSAQAADFMLYNRGDTGSVTEADFEKAVKEIQERISQWAKSRPREVQDPERSSGVNRRRYVWTHTPHQAELEYSYSTGDRAQGRRFLPEYIRVRCMGYDRGADMGSRVRQKMLRHESAVSALELKQNVQRGENGDVRIDGIPMVDQGEKGYCAVATAERVLRYYGRDVDAHQLAQLAMTSAVAGTSPDNMLDALRTAGAKLGCRVSERESFTYASFKRLVADYNRKVRRAGKPQIELGRQIMVGDVYRRMELDFLREARLGQAADYKRFLDDVRSYAVRGVPLCWSVVVGRIEEKPPVRGAGGHMRLITGYNDQTSELLYSDSWGRGHELKRMAMDDAWTITFGVYAVEPGRLR